MVVALILFLLAAVILGYRIIAAVPPLLHTPLMSGMNALSGITVLGALTVYLTTSVAGVQILAALAMVLATINLAGGFWVTERMLKMFSKKDN